MRKKTIVYILIAVAVLGVAGGIWFFMKGPKGVKEAGLPYLPRGSYAVIVVPDPVKFFNTVSSSPFLKKLEKLEVWQDLKMLKFVRVYLNAKQVVEGAMGLPLSAFLKRLNSPAYLILTEQGRWNLVFRVSGGEVIKWILDKVKGMKDQVTITPVVKGEKKKKVSLFRFSSSVFVGINSKRNLIIVGDDEYMVGEMTENINTVSLSDTEAKLINWLSASDNLVSFVSFGGYKFLSNKGETKTVIWKPFLYALPFGLGYGKASVSLSSSGDKIVFELWNSEKLPNQKVPLVSFAPDDILFFFSDSSRYLKDLAVALGLGSGKTNSYSANLVQAVRNIVNNQNSTAVFVRKIKRVQSGFSLRGGLVIGVNNLSVFKSAKIVVDFIADSSMVSNTISVGGKKIPVLVKSLMKDDVGLCLDSSTSNVVVGIDSGEAIDSVSAFYGKIPSLRDSNKVKKILSQKGYSNPTVFYINFRRLAQNLYVMMRTYAESRSYERRELVNRYWKPFFDLLGSLGEWVGTGEWDKENKVWKVVVNLN